MVSVCRRHAHMYKKPWISNAVLLQSPGNYIQSLRRSGMEENVSRRRDGRMCDGVTLPHRRKLTAHCKPAMMEK